MAATEETEKSIGDAPEKKNRVSVDVAKIEMQENLKNSGAAKFEVDT